MISLKGLGTKRFGRMDPMMRNPQNANTIKLQAVIVSVFLFGLLVLSSPATALDSNGVNSILRGDPAKSDSHSQSVEPDIASPSTVSQLGQGMSVVVLTFKGDKFDGHGSGVFLGNGLFVTNHHVVKDCDGFRLVLPDGRQVDGKLRAVGDMENDLDLAVIETAPVDAVVGARLASDLDLLEQVYSFGFPQLALQHSANWSALMSGDELVRPDVIGSAGVIQQVFRNNKNLEVLIHSAIIRGGNSGGALIDRCGNLVGVNSWGALEQAQVKTGEGTQMTVGQGNEQVEVYASVQSGYNIAISVSEVKRFLTDRNIPFESATNECR
jgi:S1-C subfamily serine protease